MSEKRQRRSSVESVDSLLGALDPQIMSYADEEQPTVSAANPFLVKPQSRHDLILADDLSRILDALDAIDEHHQGGLTADRCMELCRLINIKYDARAFSKAPTTKNVHSPQDGPLIQRKHILRVLFPSYSHFQIEKDVAQIEFMPSGKQLGGGAGGEKDPDDPDEEDGKKFFRMCDRGNKGYVTLEDLRQKLPSSSTQQLEEYILEFSSEVKQLRKEDELTFKSLRFQQLMIAAKLPESICSLITEPPLSIDNLLRQWDLLQPQIEPHISFAQRCRLASVVVYLRRWGAKAALRVPWPADDLHATAPNYNVNWEIQRDLLGNARPPLSPYDIKLDMAAVCNMVAIENARSAGGSFFVEVAAKRKVYPAFGLEFGPQRGKLTLPKPGLCMRKTDLDSNAASSVAHTRAPSPALSHTSRTGSRSPQPRSLRRPSAALRSEDEESLVPFTSSGATPPAISIQAEEEGHAMDSDEEAASAQQLLSEMAAPMPSPTARGRNNNNNNNLATLRKKSRQRHGGTRTASVFSAGSSRLSMSTQSVANVSFGSEVTAAAAKKDSRSSSAMSTQQHTRAPSDAAKAEHAMAMLGNKLAAANLLSYAQTATAHGGGIEDTHLGEDGHHTCEDGEDLSSSYDSETDSLVAKFKYVDNSKESQRRKVIQKIGMKVLAKQLPYSDHLKMAGKLHFYDVVHSTKETAIISPRQFQRVPTPTNRKKKGYQRYGTYNKRPAAASSKPVSAASSLDRQPSMNLPLANTPSSVYPSPPQTPFDSSVQGSRHGVVVAVHHEQLNQGVSTHVRSAGRLPTTSRPTTGNMRNPYRQVQHVGTLVDKRPCSARGAPRCSVTGRVEEPTVVAGAWSVGRQPSPRLPGSRPTSAAVDYTSLVASKPQGSRPASGRRLSRPSTAAKKL